MFVACYDFEKPFADASAYLVILHAIIGENDWGKSQSAKPLCQLVHPLIIFFTTLIKLYPHYHQFCMEMFRGLVQQILEPLSLSSNYFSDFEKKNMTMHFDNCGYKKSLSRWYSSSKFMLNSIELALLFFIF